jgi:DNA-binding transcriptional regulator YiaG
MIGAYTSYVRFDRYRAIDMHTGVRGNVVVMTNNTEAELVLLGYQATLFGGLAEVRKTTGLSRNAQCRLIGVDGESLRKWESLDRAMNIESALRIGEWYWGAKAAMEGVDFSKLVPITKAAQYMGTSQGDIENAAKAGHLDHERLGVLGTFIHRSEIDMSLPLAVV